MQIVRDLGGYSYGRSDLVRRAMSKKKMDVMLEEKQYFIHGKTDAEGNVEIDGCVRRGIPEEAGEAIFADMVSFAEYAFNKSHAAAYAVVAYETGYLKAYYPVEFMAALMTSVMGDSDSIAKYIRNCTEMGIQVLPPCVNESQKKFSVVDGKIRFGLLGVKNVGEGAIDAIIAAREEKGHPKTLSQFITNLEIGQVNKKAIESLIKAGATDCLEGNRAAHMACYEGLVESAQNTSKKNIEGQISLFQIATDEMAAGGLEKQLPDIEEFSKDVKLTLEKEMLGIYLTDHPLNDYVEQMKQLATVTSDQLNHAAEGVEAGDPNADCMACGTVATAACGQKIQDGMSVIMAGMIDTKKTLITKSSKMMAFLQLEDLYGVTEVVVFPNVYERCIGAIEVDKVVAVKGTLNFKEEEAPKVLADEVLTIEEAFEKGFIQRGSYRGGQNGAAGQRQQNAGSRDFAKPQQPAGQSAQQAPQQNQAAQEQPKGLVKVKLTADMNRDVTLEQVKSVLKRHPGQAQVLIYLPEGKTLRTDRQLWAEPDQNLAIQLAAILGKENVKVERDK